MSRVAQRTAFQRTFFSRPSTTRTSLRLPCTRHFHQRITRTQTRPSLKGLRWDTVYVQEEKRFLGMRYKTLVLVACGLGYLCIPLMEWERNLGEYLLGWLKKPSAEWLKTLFKGKEGGVSQLDFDGESQLNSAEAKGARIEIITPERKTGRDGERVPTGTSTVPFFPRKIWLPRSGAVDDGKSAALPAGTGIPDEDEEYQLLGLGIRTVSFLSFEVYVVGLYVSHSDLSKLQEKIVHAVAAPGASTLVQGEKGDLRQKLLDEQGSEAIWSSVLKDAGLKSAIRIVPTRSTNFNHLRDGWVRMITARRTGPEFTDPGFEVSLGIFKTLFGARQFKKGKALLLGRAADGSLGAWLEEDDKTTGSGSGSGAAGTPNRAGEEEKEKEPPSRMTWVGGLADERISRLVWMGYLAGANVASEDARKSVVDGVIELVERPIGTVDTQVV